MLSRLETLSLLNPCQHQYRRGGAAFKQWVKTIQTHGDGRLLVTQYSKVRRHFLGCVWSRHLARTCILLVSLPSTLSCGAIFQYTVDGINSYRLFAFIYPFQTAADQFAAGGARRKSSVAPNLSLANNAPLPRDDKPFAPSPSPAAAPPALAPSSSEGSFHDSVPDTNASFSRRKSSVAKAPPPRVSVPNIHNNNNQPPFVSDHGYFSTDSVEEDDVSRFYRRSLPSSPPSRHSINYNPAASLYRSSHTRNTADIPSLLMGDPLPPGLRNELVKQAIKALTEDDL